MQGTVNPDEFYIFKPTLKQGFYPVIQKKLGNKAKTMVYAKSNIKESIINIETPKEKREEYVLHDDEIVKLAIGH